MPEFELPDLKGRAAIFRIHAKSMALERGVRFELLARLCPNATGADIRRWAPGAGSGWAPPRLLRACCAARLLRARSCHQPRALQCGALTPAGPATSLATRPAWRRPAASAPRRACLPSARGGAPSRRGTF